jgi:hypothetical protein
VVELTLALLCKKEDLTAAVLAINSLLADR